jgi:hypothetical protein
MTPRIIDWPDRWCEGATVVAEVREVRHACTVRADTKLLLAKDVYGT